LFLGHKKKRKTVKNFPIIRHFLSWYARCLESDVQRTEDSNLLLLLSGSEYVLRFLVLLLALAVTSVFGQESVVILAMVSYDQSLARTTTVARNHSATSSFPYASAPRLQSRMAALKFDNQNATDFSSDFRLEKQSGSNQRDLFQLVHKKLSANRRTGSWVLVEAGYGQICRVDSSIGKNTAELQRPGFAYLRASFSF
jgi:hypothetical protein